MSLPQSFIYHTNSITELINAGILNDFTHILWAMPGNPRIKRGWTGGGSLFIEGLKYIYYCSALPFYL